MIIVGIIHKTGLFEYIAVGAIKKSQGNPKTSLVYLMILTALASAILDNVTTILLAVPMTLIITKHLQVSPIPFILAEVFVSNIGGAATLVGDPPNIIIASKADISFNAFLIHMAPLVLLVRVDAGQRGHPHGRERRLDRGQPASRDLRRHRDNLSLGQTRARFLPLGEKLLGVRGPPRLHEPVRAVREL